MALLSKGFRATSPLWFSLTRQKGVSSFDFFQEFLVVHNRSEWWGSVDCVILSATHHKSKNQELELDEETHEETRRNDQTCVL
jgi:hypothetical protein